MSFPSSDGNPSLALMCLTRGVAASVLGLACAAAPLVGVAQESIEDTDSSLDLGTITVTGQKSERSLAETDSSVTVVFPSEGEGVAGAAYDVFGVAERLANVMPFTGGSGVTIRGIGQTGFSSGPTFGQTNYLVTRSPSDLVATYVDGIPVSVYAGPLGGFWDVDQIEVLRGAQSTVLGRGSLGGAVIIESADPTFTLEAAGQLSAGTTNGGLGTSFAVSGPIVDDRLAYRVVFDQQRGPNFIENVTLDEDGDMRQLLNRRVKLLYAGESGAEMELSTFFSEAQVGTLYVDAGSWPDQRVTRADVNTRLNNDVTGSSLRGSWPLSNVLSLESATVWVKEYATQDLDPDQTEVREILTPIGFLKNDAQFNDDVRTVSQELRLRYTGGGFNGFIGAYYEDFEGIAKTSSPIYGRKSIQQNISTAALFGEGKWSITEKMDLTLGLRAETEKNRTAIDATINDLQTTLGKQAAIVGCTNIQTKPPTEIPNCTAKPAEALREILTKPPVDEKSDQNFSILLPKLGLSYAVTPGTRLYGTVQRGYRAGGAGASLVNAVPFEFDPETTWNADLGIRHKSADGRFRFSSNLFYVDWQDQQLQIPIPQLGAIDFKSVNAGRSESYGLELDVDYQATQRLRLFGAVGLLKTAITDAPEPEETDDKDWTGNSFTMAPATTISAGLHYDFDNGLDFSLAANWRDKFFSDVENRPEEEVDGRFLVDVGAGYQFTNRDLRIDFKITNLFDEKYINHSYIKPIKDDLVKTLNGISMNSSPFLGGVPFDSVNTDGIVAPGPGRAIIMSLTGRF